MIVTKRKTAGKRSKKKTSMCSLRVEPHLKEKLQTIARQQARSLPSLIENILQNYVESKQTELPRDTIEKDRRQHPRKEILLPGCRMLRKGKNTVEHDVLIKNISAGGTYTEYKWLDL